MLWRRRLWVVVALLVAVAAGVGAYVTIEPGQESKAQVLFLGSIKQPGVAGPTNPYMNFGGSLAITASAVQQGVTSDQTAQKLYAKGNRATYAVEPNLAENAGPVLLVTVNDTSPAMVEQTLNAVLVAITDQLKTLQAAQHVPADLYITAQTLTKSPHPLAVHKAQTQKAVIAFLAVVVVLIALILLIERRRVRRHGGEKDVTVVEEDEATPGAPDLAQPGPPGKPGGRSRGPLAVPRRTVSHERGPDGAGRPARRHGRTNPPPDIPRQ